jgi:hypothetical protein
MHFPRSAEYHFADRYSHLIKSRPTSFYLSTMPHYWELDALRLHFKPIVVDGDRLKST